MMNYFLTDLQDMILENPLAIKLIFIKNQKHFKC